jgi:CRISPR-associated endonuclease/helicase Cas3
MPTPETDEVIPYLWAKTATQDETGFHPLLLHLLDVAACVEAILLREPEPSRGRLGMALGFDWVLARPWILLLAACHDLGKASPRFQAKWPWSEAKLEEWDLLPPGVDRRFHHGLASHIALEALLKDLGWPESLAEHASSAVGSHHGQREAPESLGFLDGCRSSSSLAGKWRGLRARLFGILLDTFKPGAMPTRTAFSGPDFMLLAGLTSFADWIGSNETWFPYGTPEDCSNPTAWWACRRNRADRALDDLGWMARTPLLDEKKGFEAVFHGFVPRPLQTAVEQTVQAMEQPGIVLVEAPMGEGKTEAAFYAHLELQRRHKHRGLYVALPTKATGNAMFRRTETFLQGMKCSRPLDLQLLHGATQLNEDFQKLRFSGIHSDAGEGRIMAAEWFTPHKRALLSEYGVGTVDQALLPVLPVRHQFVRLWGLANRVVVFDEIHAYDAYTGTLLHHLLDWLLALGSSVVMLSATLPPGFRRELARRTGATLSEPEVPYPRITIFQLGRVHQVPIQADPSRDRCIRVIPMAHDLDTIRRELEGRHGAGGLALALMNTVQRAQDLYQRFPVGERILIRGVVVGKRLPDGLEVYLFHARFPADQRQVREDHALDTFGRDSARKGRKLLIATQVAEQSLDLDFDLVLTDLAPVDLLLQRAGRLWRHARPTRPTERPEFLVAGLDAQEPPSFAAPLWWGKVYREDLLLRTWCILKGRGELHIPEEIDTLVRAVYEDAIPIPPALQARMDQAVVEGEGIEAAYRTFAHQSVIELGNWESGRLLKEDEDDPGRHPALAARTRLGDPSVNVVPIQANQSLDLTVEPNLAQARALAMASLSISRRVAVERLRSQGVPEGWQASPVLRQTFAMVLDSEGRWVEDPSVRMDGELGLCFEQKEAG